ncbi:hypothetical protein [Desulfosediminicola flagellatus]|uniref:hypothetical protein n=1 Tax=Desulfosediminicola flagellatus TaxID=2569541 RepID=UPI0010AC52D6|nr:hypothetical protein [Desulfosediminicola flagellatus]
METIAVYWEPVIRVYGIETRVDVAFIELNFPLDELDFHGSNIEKLAGTCNDFIMVLLQYVDQKSAKICIALKVQYAKTLYHHLDRLAEKGYKVTVHLKEHVDMVFFHGPHFQDRYGIAETAFRVLDLETVSLLAVGCTGTSVYLVVNNGEADLARHMLSKGFIIPDHMQNKH